MTTATIIKNTEADEVLEISYHVRSWSYNFEEWYTDKAVAKSVRRWLQRVQRKGHGVDCYGIRMYEVKAYEDDDEEELWFYAGEDDDSVY